MVLSLVRLADLLVIALYSAHCKTGIWNINHDKINTRLVGYKIRTFDNISPRICFDKCIRRPNCHSYNYNRHILRCELNHKPKYGSVGDTHIVVGFVYVDINHYRGDPMYDTCLGNPCKYGEICENKKDGGVVCVKDQENVEDCTKLREYQYKSGVYTIYPSNSEEGINVFCNMSNGGWTVIQRRIDGRESFHRTWIEYENGFGDLQNEFWLGNKYINLLTSIGSHKLRVELVRSDGMNFYAEYSNFDVGDGESKYILTVNGYSGNAGNYMEHNNGRRFTTYDRDYDAHSYNCVVYHGYGAWWHGGCTNSDLNNQNINKLKWNYNNFVKSIMMIQKID